MTRILLLCVGSLQKGLLKTKFSQKTFYHRYSCLNLVLCPGQDAYHVGMFGKLDRSDKFVMNLQKLSQDILGYDIISIANDGPLETLRRTKYCQAAITVSSLIHFQKLKERFKINDVNYIAGYSVGEIPALFIANKCSLEETLQLIKSRGNAMDHACRLQPTGMLSLSGLEFDSAEELCRDLNVEINDARHKVSIAIQQHEKTMTIGGSYHMLDKIMNRQHLLLRDESVRLSKIDVDGAFHTNYMQPALDSFNETLKHITFSSSRSKVFSNVTGTIYNESEMKDLLLKQIVEPVKWNKVMSEVNTIFIENNQSLNIYDTGGGRTLKTITGKVNRRLLKQYNTVT